MNLGRAKTVLIFAFLGLNIFLGYHLFGPYLGQITQTAVTAAELQQARSHLANYNYDLETDISRTVQRSTFLTVAPAQQYLNELIAPFSSGALPAGSDGTKRYRVPGRELVVHDGGQIRLDFQPGLFMGEQSHYLEDRELSRLVEQTLRDNFSLPDQLGFDYIERDSNGSLTLYYYRDFESLPLFASYIKVFMERNYITGVELYWLDPMEQPREGEMEVIPATDALIKLVEELGPATSRRKIKKVDLGYFSREYNAEMWEVPPVWRIIMEENSVYYVNAFTGNLETDV